MALPPIASTTDDFLPTADLMLEAFDRIGKRPTEITVDMAQSARSSCVLLASSWSSKGLPLLWKVTLGTLPLVQGTTTYALTPDVQFLLDCYVSVTNSGVTTDTYAYQLSRSDYAPIPNKAQQGPPTQLWFNRQITPQVNMYLTPDGGGPYTLKYYYMRQMFDTTVGMGYAPDIPFTFLDAYACDLSARLAEKYAPERLTEKLALSDKAWKIALAANRENTPMRIAPMFGAYFRR